MMRETDKALAYRLLNDINSHLQCGPEGKYMKPELLLYEQIAVKMKSDILAGRFMPGQRLPAIRKLAEMYMVNINTVLRAIAALKDKGLLITKIGQGTFVTKDMDYIHYVKEETASSRVSLFVQQMEALGYSREQVTTMMRSGIDNDKYA